MTRARMLGRAIGSGYKTCPLCCRPDPRGEKRSAKRREKRAWRREWR